MRCKCGKQMKPGFRGWECECGAVKPYIRKSVDYEERRQRLLKTRNKQGG